MFLDEEGLRVVANKINKKQDVFSTGNSLEFVTSGQGEVDSLLYLDNGVLSSTNPESRINVDITDNNKVLGIGNQLIKVQTFGFIDATFVTISSCSPQTTQGAEEGDSMTPSSGEVLLNYVDIYSSEFYDWCETYGLDIFLPVESSRTLIFYVSIPELSVRKTLNYKPDDERTTPMNSWSSLHTKEEINRLLPAPLVDSETTTIEDGTIPTWEYVDEVVDSYDNVVDTHPEVTNGFLLQKFLWETTVGATELPSTMTVELYFHEIYIGVYGYRITCNGMRIGDLVQYQDKGSTVFEENVGISWNYWSGGTFTVIFDGNGSANVQKVNVTGAVDDEAREVAAGAMALAQEVFDSIEEANNHYEISESITRPTNPDKYSAKWKAYSFNNDEEYESDLNQLSGCNIWTDGYNIYASYYRNTGTFERNCQFRLDKEKNKWVPMTWFGFNHINGEQVWTDGEHIYYSFQGDDYELNVPTHTWSVKTWNGVSNLIGSSIWSDGEHIYSSVDRDHYELVLGTNNWIPKTWNIRLYGNSVWTDGKGNIFMINTGDNYQLDKSTGDWEEMTGDTHSNDLLGYDIWTDGYNIYHSCAPDNMKFHPEDKSWEVVTFDVLDEFEGEDVWSDGKNIYCSVNLFDDTYVLCKSIQIDCRPKL